MSSKKAEIERLSDLLRWRDAEKESPLQAGRYLVIQGSPCPHVATGYYNKTEDLDDGEYWTPRNVFYWLPIPPTPVKLGRF